MKHKEAIEKNGYIVVSPISSSMRPLVRENIDFGRFESVTKHKPKILDVVLYQGYGKYIDSIIMHRIIGIDGNNYIIQGDNSSIREIIPKSEIFAVMTGYFRGNKYRSCKNPIFIICSILITSKNKLIYSYRTSRLLIFKVMRFTWRKILHNH